MGDILGMDHLSDLPQSIIECILTRLPIRDAIRTSILSRRWRYKWNTLTQLVFDDDCVAMSNDGIYEDLIYFITHVLFLHEGPIHKFHLSATYLQNTPDLDQWMLFLSRKGIRELIIELGDGEWFRVHSCLFNCSKLTLLELYRCELDPPPTFKGFLCLKSLKLHQVLIAPEDIESLIANCPLLETLALSYFDSLVLNICAPNLKYLYLEGEFRDICLKNTPLLVAISVALYMNDDTEPFGDNSDCNFEKFFGGVPYLEKLTGHVYFTKYLSIGNSARTLPVSHIYLRSIELHQVSFEDMNEILVVLRLITSSPNLEELHVSGSSNPVAASEAPDLDFWENECPSNCTFGKLKVVKTTDMSGVPHEMEFIKYLLRNCPVLETMSIRPCVYVTDRRLNMLIELLRFRRASPQAEILFIQE
ncbi:F-box/FBD/LRR-repeat protein At1g13570-like [Cucurbita pepo subsp. pepo]|uniref:F-box/FBD/LRR-repeat protein At1g13570-like n=1 Tax=Cucurbita pepo subsp. pepo TaxID=3664 RepID=UPI000C9D3B0E|nr:F-box/FBD/LRR-repeat protein At1g13570-like [Cucurbita pepo subsp. pepo]